MTDRIDKMLKDYKTKRDADKKLVDKNITLEAMVEILKSEVETMRQKAVEYALVVEQFQKLLGVYTTTSALTKIAELMVVKERADAIREALTEVAGKYHLIAEFHDAENFRGCQHPDCVKARFILKEYALDAAKGGEPK